MKKLFPLLVLALFYFSSYAQNNLVTESPKNVIHGSIGTIVASFSAHLTYDRLLKQSDNGFFKAYYASIKIGGLAGIDFSGNDGGTGNTTSITATALTGKGKNHFEVGLGLGYFRDTENIFSPSNPDGQSDESRFYPSLSIGYRKQMAKGFMFRTGFGITEWAYVGVGFSF